jgi:Zn-dependent oligopeptidase
MALERIRHHDRTWSFAWAGPFGGAPPFAKVKIDQMKPALEAAMAEQRRGPTNPVMLEFASRRRSP